MTFCAPAKGFVCSPELFKPGFQLCILMKTISELTGSNTWANAGWWFRRLLGIDDRAPLTNDLLCICQRLPLAADSRNIVLSEICFHFHTFKFPLSLYHFHTFTLAGRDGGASKKWLFENVPKVVTSRKLVLSEIFSLSLFHTFTFPHSLWMAEKVELLQKITYWVCAKGCHQQTAES